MRIDAKNLLGNLTAFQARVQEKLQALRVTASSGGNMVTVVCNGYGDIIEIRIDPEVLREPDAEVLEDLVRAAVNEAHRRAREQAGEELQSLVGVPLAGLIGLT